MIRLLIVGLFVAGCGNVAGSSAAPQGSDATDDRTLVTVEEGPTIGTRPSPYPDVDARAGSTGPRVFGFGSVATPEAIAAIDIDVRPDGFALPPGSGTPEQGMAAFTLHCARCHGPQGEGGLNDRLIAKGEVGPRGPVRGVGNYWPYATTLFDYVRRAMPYDMPGSLSDDEIYSVVAWILAEEGLIEEDAVIDRTSLPQVVMPARDRFVPDDRELHSTVH